MATPGEFVEVLAQVLGVPSATMVVHDRNLAEAGMRSKGGRGRSAARVTPRDAANLLTAVLGSALVKDSVASVKRYAETLPHRPTSNGSFRGCGMAELARLPGRHSFIDGLEALIAAATNGNLIAPLIEVAALTPGTIGDVRLAGLPDQATINIRYAVPGPWDGPRDKPPGNREVLAWEARVKKDRRTDLEQYRRISARTIACIGQLLADTGA